MPVRDILLTTLLWIGLTSAAAAEESVGTFNDGVLYPFTSEVTTTSPGQATGNMQGNPSPTGASDCQTSSNGQQAAACASPSAPNRKRTSPTAK